MGSEAAVAVGVRAECGFVRICMEPHGITWILLVMPVGEVRKIDLLFRFRCKNNFSVL